LKRKRLGLLRAVALTPIIVAKFIMKKLR